MSSKIMCGAVIVVALVTIAVAIYAMVDRRGDPTRTPGGVDYNPATQAQNAPSTG